MRYTLKMLEAAIERLNVESGYSPLEAGCFDPSTRACGAGFALESQNLRAAGDRHNRYQLHFYDGKGGTGCSDVRGSYSLTIGELYEKVQCMREAIRLTLAARINAGEV